MIRASGLFRSPQHDSFRSECLEEGHQRRVLLPWAIRSGLRRIAQRHRAGLCLNIDFGIDVGGVETNMAEPGPDRVDVVSGLKQVAGARMPYHMGA